MCWCDTFWRKISDLNLSLHIYPTQTCFAPVYSYLKHARPITTNLSSPLIWFCCLTWAQSGSAPLKRKPAMCEKKTSYLVYRVFALHSEHCWCGAKSPRQCCRYHRTPGAIPVERHSCVMMQNQNQNQNGKTWSEHCNTIWCMHPLLQLKYLHGSRTECSELCSRGEMDTLCLNREGDVIPKTAENLKRSQCTCGQSCN